MKVPVLAVYVTAAVVGLSACANPTDGGKEQQQGSASIVESVQKDEKIAAMLPDDVKTRGYFVVSINPDIEPIKFVNADGQVAGLNPDLLRAAAKVLGVEAKLQEGSFEAMVPGLAAKRFDVIGSVGDYVERQEKIDFIDYLQSGTGVVASTNVGKDITSPKDLCGLNVGYARGASPQGLVESAAKACKAAGQAPLEGSGYESSAAAVLSLKSGQADAVWTDLPLVRYTAEKDPDRYKLVYKEKSSVYGIGINKQNPQLRDALRAALLRLAANGVYDGLLKQWSQEGYGLPDFPINSDNSLKR